MLPSELKKTQSIEDITNISKISNSLINSFVKKNNLVSLKILLYLSSLDITVNNNQELQKIVLDVKKLCSYCEIDLRLLRTNLKTMQETCLTFVEFSREGVARCEENITVIPYSKYDFKGTLEIKLFTKILSLVIDVKNRFTVIDLNNLMNLKSKHSIKMIQILEYINGFGANVAKRKTYTLSDINMLFGTNYTRFKDFERKVLEPVKKELDEFSNLTFLYSLNFDKLDGVGRPKIVSVTVDLKSNKTRQLKLF